MKHYQKERIYTLFETLSKHYLVLSYNIGINAFYENRLHNLSQNNKKATTPVIAFSDPAGTRTQDPNIKSVVLYRLSY